MRHVRLLVAGIGVALCAGLVSPTPPSGSSTPSASTEHEGRTLQVRLVLLAGSLVSAGTATSGYIVVDNTGKTPVTVTQSCGGEPDMAVVLSSGAVPQSAAFSEVKCPDAHLRPGIHRYPVEVRASYQGCIEPGGSGSGLPRCLPPPDNGPPPLPVGRYQAVMHTDSSIPTAKSLPVTVIRPRADPIAFRGAPKATTRTVPDLGTLEKTAAQEARGNGDPSAHRGYIVLTTRQQAVAPALVNADQPVYQVVIPGHFRCGSCSIPPGAKVPTGTVMTTSIDRHTLLGLDFGLTRSLPRVLVGAPVYRMRF